MGGLGDSGALGGVDTLEGGLVVFFYNGTIRYDLHAVGIGVNFHTQTLQLQQDRLMMQIGGVTAQLGPHLHNGHLSALVGQEDTLLATNQMVYPYFII